MPHQVVDILRSCRLFSQVQAEGFSRLAPMARLCSFDKGEIIFRQGQACPGVYVVGAGLVRIFKIGANGKEQILHIVGPENTFAEAAAIGGFDCPAHAQAVTPATCVLLPLEPFRQLLRDNHQFCLEMMAGLTYWVKNLIGLIEDLSLRDAAGRLAWYLLKTETALDGTIELPSLKRHVASQLNLTSETFSRTLSKLVESGLVIELAGNRLQLVDRPRLAKIAAGET